MYWTDFVNKQDLGFWVSGWVLVLVTVIGNGLVIYLIITKPRLHTPANGFMLSLAVADLCVGLAFFPPLFGAKFLYTVDLTHAGLFFKVSFAFFYCSNTNLFAMTVDRFLAITKPLHYMSLMTKETVRTMIIMAWSGPFLLFFFPALFTYSNNPTFTMFVEISRVLIFQIVPIVIFIAATSRLLRIAWNVNRQTRDLIAQVRYNHATNGSNIHPPAASKAQHRNSTVLIILVMTAFNITYLGGNYRCFCYLTNACPFDTTVIYSVYLVLIANSAVNPVFYSFLKNDIQKELFKLFSR